MNVVTTFKLERGGTADLTFREICFGSPEEEDCLLTVNEVAWFLRISSGTLKFWRVRSHRSGPPFIRLGGRRSGPVRYSLAAVRRYLVERTIPTKEAEKIEPGPAARCG